jgi:hypothetical protein
MSLVNLSILLNKHDHKPKKTSRHFHLEVIRGALNDSGEAMLIHLIASGRDVL